MARLQHCGRALAITKTVCAGSLYSIFLPFRVPLLFPITFMLHIIRDLSAAYFALTSINRILVEVIIHQQKYTYLCSYNFILPE